ncbi:YibE/F family protein [Dactylosporangium fulvum]|uniref:YibE/F family protein n=1 Tax=Dactylosporangium fulvum TaxID=53359 RepID=A0ABY5W4T4_9ACTN|nr:YibE/F family protein [Dactylosporangium fulvum]UWP85073.1 YibE/F family protein [Dactylosporangium fulvum]
MTQAGPGEQHAPSADLDGHRPGHSHGHGWTGLSRRAIRISAAVLVPAAVLVVTAMALLWPRGGVPADTSGAQQQAFGKVRAVHHAQCPSGDPAAPPGTTVDCGTADVEITDGAGRGQVVVTEIPAGPGAPRVTAGDRVVLIVTDAVPGDPAGGAAQYQIIDHQRGVQLWVLGACFAAAVIAFGRWRGLSALAGLAVTFGILLYFIVPAILAGRPPLLVAVVGSAAIMLTVLYLTHGLSAATSIAVVGTLASLCLTGLLSQAATIVTSLNGVAGEESAFLTVMYQQVDMRGLLLAGILIGSLGVLDDVAVTQAFTVTELSAANPALGFRGLYRSAIRVGRAHIASVVNTIVLAYAGASLPLLLLLAAGSQPVGQVLTSQLMAQEIVRSVVGTIGLISAVPITTALAAYTAGRRRGLAAAVPSVAAPAGSPAAVTEPGGRFADDAAGRAVPYHDGDRPPAAAVPPRGEWDWDDPDDRR